MKAKPRTVVPAIIGTAGHIDHGKTALVRNLTGCETDQLPEEKKRGLSINLGFAPCALRGGLLAGIVDVPGHEDFIRNMVAGAASMDIVMLVVAADDGVMPQTREHLQIIQLLRTPRVFAVLTKTDLVGDEMLELVRQDVAEFLSGLGYPDAPILAVSNKTFEGLDEVRKTLREMIDSLDRSVDPDRAFRMNVERTFSVKGYGTVVTGIPLSGNIQKGKEIELLPSGKRSVVRYIQTYKLERDHVEESVCGALNLRQIEIAEVERGMTVATPGVFRETKGIIARLRNISDTVTLHRRTKMTFHVGTSVTDAACLLLDRESLPPGGEAFVRITFADPIVTAAGDRYIVRLPSPTLTVGGGAVCSVRPLSRFGLNSEVAKERLRKARDLADRGDFLGTELLLGTSAVLSMQTLERFTQKRPGKAGAMIRERIDSGELIDLGSNAFLVAERLPETTRVIRSVLDQYHREQPYSQGIEPEHACSLFDLRRECYDGLCGALTRDPEIVLRNGRLALKGFEPTLSRRQMELREKILAAVREAGDKPPARGDLVTSLGIPEAEMKVIVKVLVDERAIRIVRTNLIAYDTYVRYRDALLELFRKKDTVSLAEFREATGTNRNVAMSVLETFDHEGLTRREGDSRVLVPHSGASS